MTTDLLSKAKLDTGIYRFPDGSRVYPSIRRPGKWLACWADGTLLRSEDKCGVGETKSYFDSAEQAAQALAAGGEGPAERKAETGPDSHPEATAFIKATAEAAPVMSQGVNRLPFALYPAVAAMMEAYRKARD